MTPATLFAKIWNAHVVDWNADGGELLYIDRHLIHEVSTPQAFTELAETGRTVRRPDLTFAMADHSVPTSNRRLPIADADAALQLRTLSENCRANGIELLDMHHPLQGIVHIVGPELGLTLPGTTLVCGDSHTSTHGALGALAFGIGTSEVGHVLATQTLRQRRPRAMRVLIHGRLPADASAKDLALHVVATLGAAGGAGTVIEFQGPAVGDLEIEQRLTLCNMSIEAGARAALIAPDDKTFRYLEGRPFSPRGKMWDRAIAYWQTLKSDADAVFDAEARIDASRVVPFVTWGTSPDDVVAVAGSVPDPDIAPDERRAQMRRALDYMGLVPNTPIRDLQIDVVFIGSCTNGRLEDLRVAAGIAAGRHVKQGVRAIVVPGSGSVKRAAEELGIAQTLIGAGFEWRDPGCSMCVAMNDDRLSPGQRCVSTSNRNFEGRQGRGGRTHLASPAVAAASAIAGRIAAPSDL